MEMVVAGCAAIALIVVAGVVFVVRTVTVRRIATAALERARPVDVPRVVRAVLRPTRRTRR